MAAPPTRDSEYVILPEEKPKIIARYDDDDVDDDAETQIVTTTGRVVRTKPVKEQVKYVTTKNGEFEYRRPRRAESFDNRIKVHQTTSGEQVILDEDDNILKIVRNPRTPSPPTFIGNRRVKVRVNEPRTVYYETSDGQLIARRQKYPEIVGKKVEYVYSDDEGPKIVKKLVIDPKTGEQEIIYEKERSKKHSRPKIIVRKPVTEIQLDSDDEEQTEYVQVVQRRPGPTKIIAKKESPSKFVMIRKKVEPETVYETIPAVTTIKPPRRIVYKTSPRKAPIKYVYATDGKY